MNNFRQYKGGWVAKENPHLQQKITKEEAQRLLAGGYFVRNAYNFDSTEPTGFWYIIKDSWNGMDELPTKVRNQVRKSLKCYDIKKVTAEEMELQGYDVYNLSRKRFGIKTEITREQWHRQIFNAEQDYWLAMEKETGDPQALALNKRYDQYCDYITMGVNPDAPKSTYPMYGLIYEMNRYYLEEKKVSFVCDGARSITEHSNIQSVLEEKFKFRKAYCDLQVFYKSWLRIAVRLLFPFRSLIKHSKVAAILRQEAWARGLEK
jgi:hypothetical protein